jgi:hypothetical protein
MSKRNRIIATLAIAAVTTLGLAGPAQAHQVKQGGNDYAYHSVDGKQLTVCDVQNDDRAVWAGYYTSASNRYRILKINYPAPPAGPIDCATVRVGTRLDSIVLTNFRVVEDKPNSSTNYYSPWHGYPVRGN